MSTAFRTSLIAVLALVPALALAAPKKAHKTVTTTTTTTETPAPAAAQGTLLGNTNGNIMSALKGLSVYAAYDFADTAESSNSQAGKTDTERAFDIGMVYEVNQFASGIAAQAGIEYDFQRATKNPAQGQSAIKFSQILPYAELTAHLTPMFKLMGGLNYNFPSFDGYPSGVTMKGAIGFQVGGSVAFNEHLAIDARYRSVQFDRSIDAAASATGANYSDTVKENGFVMGGRYMF